MSNKVSVNVLNNPSWIYFNYQSNSFVYNSTIFQEPFVKSFNTLTDYALCKIVDMCKNGQNI